MNKAFVRLKGKPEIKHTNYKKNVRKNSQGEGKSPSKAPAAGDNEETFKRLLEISTKLFDTGYISIKHRSQQIDIYTDSKEDVVFERNQISAAIERAKNAAKKEEPKPESAKKSEEPAAKPDLNQNLIL